MSPLAPLPSPPPSPPTALERNERRPAATVLFLAALFALPMGTCGGIGTWKATDVGREIAPTSIAALETTRDGSYVSFDAPLRHFATDELPLRDKSLALARGISLYTIDGAPAVYVAAKKGALSPGERVHVAGRVCSADSSLVCDVDDEGVRMFLRSEERRTKGTIKVVTLGARPSENIAEAAVGLGIAAVLGALLLAVVFVILRGRRKPFVYVERVVPLRHELDLGRLPAALGPAFRQAQLTPEPCTFLTGVKASRAQAVGAFQPSEFPQRVEIWRELGNGAYRELHARVRVSEIFAQPAGPLPQIMPSVQVALETTLARVVAAIGGG
ncbi:MAG: hypothetical protein JST00_46365 [Deltaproteobacteria bacterium]|nr:hypothetical protein [Deltaproteobacteria bacterium]